MPVGPQEIFYYPQIFIIFCYAAQQNLYAHTRRQKSVNIARMKSLPFTPRVLVASEARLESIYAAARRGLKGDSLALAANMLPSEYNRLKALDPVVEMAELKGRADMEQEMADVMLGAARTGDTKAAQFMLTHRADWVAKQQINVDVTQQISITAALEAAQQRIWQIDEQTSLLQSQ